MRLFIFITMVLTSFSATATQLRTSDSKFSLDFSQIKPMTETEAMSLLAQSPIAVAHEFDANTKFLTSGPNASNDSRLVYGSSKSFQPITREVLPENNPPALAALLNEAQKYARAKKLEMLLIQGRPASAKGGAILPQLVFVKQ